MRQTTILRKNTRQINKSFKLQNIQNNIIIITINIFFFFFYKFHVKLMKY